MAETPDPHLVKKLGEQRQQLRVYRENEAEEKPKLETVTVEERQFGVSGEARADFARLWDEEVRALGVCPLKKIGSGPKDTAKCKRKLKHFQDWLVHHAMHLMTVSDSRVQKQTNSDQRELVYPTSEKMIRAALPLQDRQRMVKDRDRRRRELQQGASQG